MNSLIRSFVKINILLLAIVLGFACHGPQRTRSDSVNTNSNKIIQGVTGKVVFKEGNFNASGEIMDHGKVYGVERQLFFYELTSIKDAEIGEGDFVKTISSEILDSAYSDRHGHFMKELPVGKYSVFIQESKRLYSKVGDNDYFFPIVIKDGERKEILFEIDYKANYLLGKEHD